MLVEVPKGYFLLDKLLGWRFAGVSCWPPLSLPAAVCHIIKPGGDTRVSRHANVHMPQVLLEMRGGFLAICQQESAKTCEGFCDSTTSQ